MERSNNFIIVTIMASIIFLSALAVLAYYIYKKYSPSYKDNRGELMVSQHLHPYNQCLTIVMNESRKNQEVIKIEKARELCLEMVKTVKDGKK